MLSNLITLLEGTPILLASILGLLVGSFLNVVILRLPKRMQHDWTIQSEQWLNRDSLSDNSDPQRDSSTNSPPPGIVKQGSHCPKCKAKLKPWHNIPVVSYLFLRGKCSNCNTKISIRYPSIEILTAILSATVIYKFGISAQGGCALLITWCLVALTFIDIDHQLLPDDIVLPLVWAGLLASLVPIFATPNDAIIGAAAGYLSLWSVFQLFKLFTGKDGMGFGDFKLLALLGAWLGWQYLPQIIIMSTLLGSVIGITLMALKLMKRENSIPFGPYLAVAGWIAMLWGDKINNAYLGTLGL